MAFYCFIAVCVGTVNENVIKRKVSTYNFNTLGSRKLQRIKEVLILISYDIATMYHYILRSNLASPLPIYQSSHSINNETIWYLVILQQLLFLINKVPSCIYPRITSMSKLFYKEQELSNPIQLQYNKNKRFSGTNPYRSLHRLRAAPIFWQSVERKAKKRKMTARKLGTMFSRFASARFVPNFHAVTKNKVLN